MKKALVILLILAVAGGLFAQDWVFTGGIWGGVNISIPNGEDEDPTMGLETSEGDAWRLRWRGVWQNEAGNAGLNFRLQINNAADRTVALHATDSYAFGWLKAMDGMFTFYAGKLDGGPFETLGAISNHLGLQSGTGLRMDVVPIPGLTLGLGAFANTRSFGGMKVAQGKYNFGFNYELPGLVIINGGIGSVWDNQAVAYDDDNKFVAAIIGANILALNGMGISRLGIDAGIFQLDNMSDLGELRIGERVEFTMGPLFAGIRFMQRFMMDDNIKDKSDYSPELTFTGFVRYAIGNLVPRLGVGFVMGSPMRINNPVRMEWDAVGRLGTLTDPSAVVGYSKDAKNFYVRPSIQFWIDGPERYIELGYAGMIDLSEDAFIINKRDMVHNIFVQMRMNWF